MWTALEKLLDKGVSTILTIAGVVLILVSFVTYAKQGEASALNLLAEPHRFPLGAGALITLSGVAIYCWENLSGFGIARHKVVRNGNGYSARRGEPGREIQISIIFGRIEEQPLPTGKTEAIVLPANEFFDKECFSDRKAALGAFALHHFPGEDFQALLAGVEQCISQSALPSTMAEKEKGVNVPSYGIGTCLFLNNPVSKSVRLIVSSVSTKRAAVGIRSELVYLFSAVPKIQSMMADHGIDSVTLPLLGSGKGGIGAELALFTLIVGFLDAVRLPGGHQIKSVTLVIYQASAAAKPLIPKPIARRILGVATGMVR